MENSALRARSDRYDGARNAGIDLNEFSALLEALGVGSEEAQVRAAFAGLDTDQDGQIDFAECSGGWGAEASRAAQTREALRRRDLQGHRRRSAWVTRSQRSWNQVEPTAAELAALGAPRSSCSK